jgi:hypothetical protein
MDLKKTTHTPLFTAEEARNLYVPNLGTLETDFVDKYILKITEDVKKSAHNNTVLIYTFNEIMMNGDDFVNLVACFKYHLYKLGYGVQIQNILNKTFIVSWF